MPLYSATAPCNSISPGDTATIVNGETLTSGQASARLFVSEVYGQSNPSLSVLVSFPSDPGTFEIDVQQADVDADANYLNVSVGYAITTVDSVNFNARADFAPFLGKFVRVKMKTQSSNSIAATVKVSR